MAVGRRRQLRVLLHAMAWGVVGIVSTMHPAGLVAAAIPVAFRRAVEVHRRRRAGARVEEDFPEAIERLADAVRSKGSLRLGLAEVAANGPDSVRWVFGEATTRLDSGIPLDDAVEAIRSLGDVHGMEQTLLALRLHIGSGGNLPSSLDAIAAGCRDRLGVLRELRATTAQGRFSGWVVAVAPLGFALFASSFGLSGRFLLTFPVGVSILVIGVALDAFGFFWIRRVSEVRW